MFHVFEESWTESEMKKGMLKGQGVIFYHVLTVSLNDWFIFQLNHMTFQQEFVDMETNFTVLENECEKHYSLDPSAKSKRVIFADTIRKAVF